MASFRRSVILSIAADLPLGSGYGLFFTGCLGVDYFPISDKGMLATACPLGKQGALEEES